MAIKKCRIKIPTRIAAFFADNFNSVLKKLAVSRLQIKQNFYDLQWVLRRTVGLVSALFMHKKHNDRMVEPTIEHILWFYSELNALRTHNFKNLLLAQIHPTQILVDNHVRYIYQHPKFGPLK